MNERNSTLVAERTEDFLTMIVEEYFLKLKTVVCLHFFFNYCKVTFQCKELFFLFGQCHLTFPYMEPFSFFGRFVQKNGSILFFRINSPENDSTNRWQL